MHSNNIRRSIPNTITPSAKLTAVLLLLAPVVLSFGAATSYGIEPFTRNGKTLQIQGIGLADGPDLCPNVEATQYGMNLGGEFFPSEIMYTCRFGTAEDGTTVYYDSSKAKVVRVVRYLYVDDSESSVDSIIDAATQFYGEPDFYEENAWAAAYGSGFTVSHNGKRVEFDNQPDGQGLVIHGELCFEVSCPGDYDERIRFELIDQAAYAKALSEGAKRLTEFKESAGGKVAF